MALPAQTLPPRDCGRATQTASRHRLELRPQLQTARGRDSNIVVGWGSAGSCGRGVLLGFGADYGQAQTPLRHEGAAARCGTCLATQDPLWHKAAAAGCGTGWLAGVPRAPGDTPGNQPVNGAIAGGPGYQRQWSVHSARPGFPSGIPR
ncbi:hypothetical protein GCM10010437_048670 [Actinoplanes palleronii]